MRSAGICVISVWWNLPSTVRRMPQRIMMCSSGYWLRFANSLPGKLLPVDSVEAYGGLAVYADDFVAQQTISKVYATSGIE